MNSFRENLQYPEIRWMSKFSTRKACVTARGRRPGLKKRSKSIRFQAIWTRGLPLVSVKRSQSFFRPLQEKFHLDRFHGKKFQACFPRKFQILRKCCNEDDAQENFRTKVEQTIGSFLWKLSRMKINILGQKYSKILIGGNIQEKKDFKENFNFKIFLPWL